jgi:hypothetical protein
MNKSQQRIEYVPPKSETIRAFAQAVCEQLATQQNDPIFRQPQAIRWLADLLELAARVQTKHLNAEQLVDKDEK